jgi:hypothetical protein
MTAVTTVARVRRLGSSRVVVVRVKSVVPLLALTLTSFVNTVRSVVFCIGQVAARSAILSTRWTRLQRLVAQARPTSAAKTFGIGGRLSLLFEQLAGRTPVTACSLKIGRCLRRLLLLLLHFLALAKRASRRRLSCIFRRITDGVCFALPFARLAARS